MSHGPYLCEYCGYGSMSKAVCTHCGRDISELVDQPLKFSPPILGKLTIRPYDRSDTERTWKDLATQWDRLEQETNLGIQPSQMEKFPPAGEALELYGTNLEVSLLHKALPGKLTIEFQEVPRDEYPHRDPPYKLPRPPTVPRNKR
jgi:hypothetical protein